MKLLSYGLDIRMEPRLAFSLGGQELDQKTAEFASTNDNLEEVFENREQIEIAKFYEKLPKPTLIAVHEFLNEQIYIRNPHKVNSTSF